MSLSCGGHSKERWQRNAEFPGIILSDGTYTGAVTSLVRYDLWIQTRWSHGLCTTEPNAILPKQTGFSQMNILGIHTLLQIPAQAPAQNAPVADEMTGGQVLAGLMVLLTMVASLIVLSIWLTRFFSTGNALPAANRGVLRVPPVLTFLIAGLSGFFALMMFLSQLNVPPAATAPNPAAPTAPAAPVPPDSVPTAGSEIQNAPPVTTDPDSPDAPLAPVADSKDRIPNVEERLADPTGENAEAVRKAKEQAEALEQMRDSVVTTLMLDLILLVVLGAVILYVGQHGRVRLETAGTVSAADEAQMFSTPMRWNDLDDPSTGFGQTSQQILYSQNLTGVPPATDDAPSEPFSFGRELWFAAEVFLAVYLPTALLRLFILKLIERMTGEMPEQHPFLEMLDEGVGPGIMGLIFIIAVVFAPIVEELQFRVVILGGIAQHGMSKLGLIASSILFAFAHGYPDCFALLPLAFVLGYTYLRRRSYITVMMVHFLFNLFNMGLALLALL